MSRIRAVRPVRPVFGLAHAWWVDYPSWVRLAPLIYLLALSALGACGGDETVDLTVNLRTDYQPLRQFSSVEVEVDGDSQPSLAMIDGTYLRPGQPLVTFSGLQPSKRRPVKVTLKRLGGAELTSSTVLVAQDSDLILTVSLTRDCQGCCMRRSWWLGAALFGRPMYRRALRGGQRGVLCRKWSRPV